MIRPGFYDIKKPFLKPYLSSIFINGYERVQVVVYGVNCVKLFHSNMRAPWGHPFEF